MFIKFQKTYASEVLFKEVWKNPICLFLSVSFFMIWKKKKKKRKIRFFLSSFLFLFSSVFVFLFFMIKRNILCKMFNYKCIIIHWDIRIKNWNYEPIFLLVLIIACTGNPRFIFFKNIWQKVCVNFKVIFSCRRTGRRPVQARVTLEFRLNFKVIISCRTHWTSAC